MSEPDPNGKPQFSLSSTFVFLLIVALLLALPHWLEQTGVLLSFALGGVLLGQVFARVFHLERPACFMFATVGAAIALICFDFLESPSMFRKLGLVAWFIIFLSAVFIALTIEVALIAFAFFERRIRKYIRASGAANNG